MKNLIHFQNAQTNNDTYANVNDTSFNSSGKSPIIQATASVHPLAVVAGNVHLGQRVTVASAASIRGYEGQPVWVGNDVQIQNCVVLHALDAYHDREFVEEALVEVAGEFYGAYIEDRVSLTHQCQIHGPASIGADTFVGMQSLIFKAIVGKNCIIEPKALIMGVEIGDGRYVPAGALITTQAAANQLPFVNYSDHCKSLSKFAAEIDSLSASVYSQEMQQKLRIA
jgi:carbonic anhydrase